MLLLVGRAVVDISRFKHFWHRVEAEALEADFGSGGL